ncbi:MAG: InlB B-repeat-containing protein, partial [Clostridia bacterium]|nr:InlB B-repeat-containing protein [Clostridia bacterium]
MKRRIICIIISIITVFAGIVSFGACNSEETKYEVKYETDGNGTIHGEATQTLKSGEKTSTVTPVPNEGYEFLKWSDDSTQAKRSDTVKDSDLKFTAYFEKCTYNVSYTSNDGGTIEGDAEQTVKHGESATTVTAMPYAGYGFARWSDNLSTDPVRTDTNITRHMMARAIFERTSYDKKAVTYLTDGNGTIEGQASQQVLIGENATTVKAIANDGYEFLKWSDGVTTAERQELRVAENKTLTAQFRCIYATYKLNYRLGEADTDITEFTFYDNDFEVVEFPVPTRELFTFEGWYIGDKQVTDENGTMVAGKEILQRAEKEIYAKWTANENYTYKMLIVYVTEVDALIPVRDGSRKIQVNYEMSDIEKQVCHAITKQMKTYLDDMFDGLVNFDVDEYFTENAITSEYVSNGSIGSSQFTHYIMPYKIPEINNLLEDYQTVLTSFSFNDYDYELHNSSGLAQAKYGAIHFDTLFSDLIVQNEPIEKLLDLTHWGWDRIVSTYIHEMAHTIEMNINAYNFHSVLK